MKAILALALAGAVAAQYTDSSSDSTTDSMPASSIAGNATSAYYTTIYAYTDVCSNKGYTSTSTGTITSHVCNECNGGKGAPGVLTTYTTVMNSICPTGSTLSPVTYTVTEPCSETGKNMPAGHMPQGFDTTVAACSCPGGSATITAPTAAPPTPAPVAPPAPMGTGSPATMTIPVNLASNGTACSGAGASCHSPAAPMQLGAGSKTSFSIHGAFMAVFAAVAYIF